MRKYLIIFLLGFGLSACSSKMNYNDLEDRYTTDINPYTVNTANSPSIENLSQVQYALNKMSEHYYADSKTYYITPIKNKEFPTPMHKNNNYKIKKNIFRNTIILKKDGLHIPGE